MAAVKLARPRYVRRLLPVQQRRGNDIYAVFDTFAQEFATKVPASRAVADRHVETLNRLYERGRSAGREMLEPVDAGPN